MTAMVTANPDRQRSYEFETAAFRKECGRFVLQAGLPAGQWLMRTIKATGFKI
jgi:hypothetical protein